jgi:hypothetical protein
VIYSYINTWADARITTVNASISGTVNDFFKVTTGLEIELVSSNQKEKHYVLKIERCEERVNEANVFDFEGLIELSFILTQADTVKYQAIIDTYLWALVKNIKANHRYAPNTTFLFECEQAGFDKGNDFDEGTFIPTITLKGYVVDAS